MTPTAALGLFCNPESRRVEGVCAALGRAIRQRPVIVPWLKILDRREWEPVLDSAPGILRLESAGRNWLVEQHLLLWGSAVKDEEFGLGWLNIAPEVVRLLENDPGRIHPQRQWFLGWRELLGHVAGAVQHRGLQSRWMCPPEDVVCMFDKAACHTVLKKNGAPVPPALGVPRNFDELWEWMRLHQRQRVFLKPCHGSSASALVAFETSGNRMQACTTAETVKASDGWRLYNRRRICTLRDVAEVRRLIDLVCAHRCLAQVWIPKAGLSGKPFDVRIVVIGGHARQVMVRLGRGPITNSQLLGGKGDALLLRKRMGDDAWDGMLRLCERTLRACFPHSLYAGFDVLVEPNFRTVHILEVNAFGDLMPRVLVEDLDTYDWEIGEALVRRSQVSAMGA